MRIAVTGCNGRVGQPVVRCALRLGHEVVGIDVSESPPVSTNADSEANNTSATVSYFNNPKFTFIKADLREYDVALKCLQGCDAVIQLAAFPHPKDYIAITHNKCVPFSSVTEPHANL